MSIKKVPLTKGQYAVVDLIDYQDLSTKHWQALFQPNRKNKFYAVRAGKRKSLVYMHREILGEIVNGKFVDHIDGNGLNNRRSNLRVCSNRQNMLNRGKARHNKSGFKGVSWHPQCKKWRADISYQGKSIYLGLFTSKKKAAQCYIEAASKYHMEFMHS